MTSKLTLRYGQTIIELDGVTPILLNDYFYEGQGFDPADVDGIITAFIDSARAFYNVNKNNPNGVMIHFEVKQRKYDRDYTDIKSKWIGFPMKETFEKIYEEFERMLECPK